MESLNNLHKLVDEIELLNSSHRAFFRFLNNAIDNWEGSGTIDVRSPDGDNLHVLVDLFDKDIRTQLEAIKVTLKELRNSIDR